MMQFTEPQKRFLQELGRTDTGRQLVEILNDMDTFYSSITTIDKSRPTDSQIEGRTIFSQCVKELTTAIQTQKHRPKPIPTESYE